MKKLAPLAFSAIVLFAAPALAAGHAGAAPAQAARHAPEAGRTEAAPALGEMLLSPEHNPLVTMTVAFYDKCPLDFVGLAKDLGEAAGLIDPYAGIAEMPAESFGDQMRIMHARERAGRSLWKKVMNRSCLLSRLFGDGTCARQE